MAMLLLLIENAFSLESFSIEDILFADGIDAKFLNFASVGVKVFFVFKS